MTDPALSDENIEAGAADLAKGARLLGEVALARVFAAVLRVVRDTARSESLAELAELRARVAQLEAPPVVPDGYEVHQHTDNQRWVLMKLTDDDPLWLLGQDAMVVCREEDFEEQGIHPDAVAALLWAIKTDKRPLHAGDRKPEVTSA